MERAPEAFGEAGEPRWTELRQRETTGPQTHVEATSSRFADEDDGMANGRRRVEGHSRIFGLHSWKGRMSDRDSV